MADVGRVLEVELVRGLAVVLGRAGAGLDVRVGLDGVVPVHLDGDAAAHRGRRRRFISTPTGRFGEAVLVGRVGSGRLQARADRVVERLELGAVRRVRREQVRLPVHPEVFWLAELHVGHFQAREAVRCRLHRDDELRAVLGDEVVEAGVTALAGRERAVVVHAELLDHCARAVARQLQLRTGVVRDAMPLAAQRRLVDRRRELERVVGELRALRVRNRVGDGARARVHEALVHREARDGR